MSPRDRVYVGHMLDMTTKSIEKIRGLTREQFDSDENLRLALIYLIQIIGEAASRVSSSYRDEHPDVPWSEITGMRHKVVHDYLGVDEDIVWRVANDDLPPLAETLTTILGESS